MSDSEYPWCSALTPEERKQSFGHDRCGGTISAAEDDEGKFHWCIDCGQEYLLALYEIPDDLRLQANLARGTHPNDQRYEWPLTDEPVNGLVMPFPAGFWDLDQQNENIEQMAIMSIVVEYRSGDRTGALGGEWFKNTTELIGAVYERGFEHGAARFAQLLGLEPDVAHDIMSLAWNGEDPPYQVRVTVAHAIDFQALRALGKRPGYKQPSDDEWERAVLAMLLPPDAEKPPG